LGGIAAQRLLHRACDNGGVPMREDCRHFESRTYAGGEVARFSVLGLAPEAPWRCPADCSHYEPTLIDGTFQTAPLVRPPVEDEHDDTPANIEGVLADAEAIVEAAEPDAIRAVEASIPNRRWWQRRKRRSSGGDDGDFRLNDR
jgi:hypothetical protein